VIGPCKITSASERRRVEGCQPHKAGEAVELAALSKLEGRFTVTVLARSPLPLLVRGRVECCHPHREGIAVMLAELGKLEGSLAMKGF